MRKRQPARAVPVLVLTGYLGAGKTSLLNHLLRHPDARIGVVVNDFGDLNIDAGLVVGQVDEPFAISGGCICCLSDDTSLDDALTALSAPKLSLDAIIVEASGFAEPLTLARMITRMGHHRFHLGGVIDVVDATMHLDTVDTESAPPMRYAATTLVLVNKLDQVPAGERDERVDLIRERVHRRNPRVLVLGTSFGRLDPGLIFDPGSGTEAGAASAGEGDESIHSEEPMQAELPIRELIRQAYQEAAAQSFGDDSGADGHAGSAHTHAQSVTVTGRGRADANAVIDMLEDLPDGVYRVKGSILVADGRGATSFGVQAVGPNVYVSRTPKTGKAMRGDTALPAGAALRADTAAKTDDWDSAIVVIGKSFDADAVRARLVRALDGAEDTAGIDRLRHYLRLHS